MPKCVNCSKNVSILNYDLLSGCCTSCTSEAQARDSAINETARERERERRATEGSPEPVAAPLDGLHLIGIGVAGEFIAGILAAMFDHNGVWLAVVIGGVSSIFFIGGIIRWAVSGSNFIQLDRIQKQNARIIHFFENQMKASPLEEDPSAVLKRLHDSGQLTDVEYEEEKKNLIMKK